MNRLFLLEDDDSLIDGLQYVLTKNGYEVEVARSVAQARLLLAERPPYDLLLLDVTLPDGTGFSVCEQVRRTGSAVPILFLTAADEETDIIMGLDMGGDDYITKPFKLAVFLSRVNALLRRSENFDRPQAEPVLQSNGILVQLLQQEVTKDGVPLDLTAGEYKLLCLFMENPDRVLAPEQILGKLWDCSENYVDNNTLTVYIRRLRRKIEDDPSEPRRIVTVRRMGYKWSTSGAGTP